MLEYDDAGRDIIFIIILISVFVIHSVTRHRMDFNSENIYGRSPANWK